MNHSVTIRMYNVGFGDSFLVRIPTPSGPRKILFDCGSIKAADASIADVVKQLVEDVRDDDGTPRVDVVVATHRHKDHVSGFANSAWKSVEVKEIWMPWTEDPKDPQARKIRETQSRLAASLQARLAVDGSDDARRFLDLAVNALSNEAAMITLHRGFSGDPLRRFLPEKVKPDQDLTIRTFKTDALPGVVVHILGPSRDPQIIRDMDPPAGQSYLQLIDSSDDGDVSPPDPFSEDWWVTPATYPYPNLAASDADRTAIDRFGTDLAPAVATSLDKAVNGTSLMMVLEIGDKCLFFPGDAQWGTWQAALEDPEWRALLKTTTFYKVGHHGSHNATPINFVEKTIGSDFWAMVSTAHVDNWPRIPKVELLEALGRRTQKVARSDQLDQLPSGFTAHEKLYVETTIPV